MVDLLFHYCDCTDTISKRDLTYIYDCHLPMKKYLNEDFMKKINNLIVKNNKIENNKPLTKLDPNALNEMQFFLDSAHPIY